MRPRRGGPRPRQHARAHPDHGGARGGQRQAPGQPADAGDREPEQRLQPPAVLLGGGGPDLRTGEQRRDEDEETNENPR